MFKKIALMSLACGLTPALAAYGSGPAQSEISFQVGSFFTDDEAFDVFSTDSMLTGYGLRGGVALTHRRAAVGGYHRAVTGVEVLAGEGERGEPDPVFRSAYYSNTATLGLKYSIQLGQWLRPYVTAQGMGIAASARMDANPDDSDDATQLHVRGLGAGFLGAGGMDVQLPFGRRAWTPGMALEMGYARTLDMQLEELGRLQFAGLYINWNVGVRF